MLAFEECVCRFSCVRRYVALRPQNHGLSPPYRVKGVEGLGFDVYGLGVSRGPLKGRGFRFRVHVPPWPKGQETPFRR